MNDDATIRSLLKSLNEESSRVLEFQSSARKWQSKASLQSKEIERLTKQVESLRAQLKKEGEQ